MKKFLIKLLLKLRSSLYVHVKTAIRDTKDSIRARCVSYIEYYRFKSLYEKEPGTVDWLHNTFNESSVLLDIGANVGLYSILAAKLGGEKSYVYAVEPNAFNFARLLENIGLNQVQDRIKPLNVALSSEKSVQDFFYNSSIEGASGSQVGQPVTEYGVKFDVVLTEKKECFTVDSLVDIGMFEKQVTHVKIDVDGHELQILKGMRDFLTSKCAPKYIQVEINPGLSKDIGEILQSICS